MRTIKINEPEVLRELVWSVITMPNLVGRVSLRSAVGENRDQEGPWLAIVPLPDGTLELSVGNPDEEMPPDPLRGTKKRAP